MRESSNLDSVTEVTRPYGVIQFHWNDFEMARSNVVIAPKGPGFAGCSSGGGVRAQACIYWIIVILQGSVVHSNQAIAHARDAISMQIFRSFALPWL
jgi:hypothetical protein